MHSILGTLSKCEIRLQNVKLALHSSALPLEAMFYTEFTPKKRRSTSYRFIWQDKNPKRQIRVKNYAFTLQTVHGCNESERRPKL